MNRDADIESTNPVTAEAPWLWERQLTETFLPGQVLVRDNPAGRIERRVHLNRLLVAQLTVAPQTVEHAAAHLDGLSRDERSSLMVHVVMEGGGYIEQRGTVLPFRPGDISFRNLHEPSRVVFEETTRLFVIRLPATTLNLSPGGRGFDAVPAPRIVGNAKILADATSRLLQDMAVYQGQRLEDLYTAFALPWLLAGCYHSQSKPELPSPNVSRWQQIMRYIDEHLFDAEQLSPAACASAVGVTERYVHRLFALRTLRFSRFVQDRRLEAAHALLRNPSYRTQSVSSIAYQCGFTEAGHFSRVFRKRYGVTPSALRRSSIDL